MIQRSSSGVDRPIFIVAPPRAGTTLLYRCLTSHPQVGYFNRLNRKFPTSPRLAQWLTKAGLGNDAPRESRALWDRFWHRGQNAEMNERHVTEECRDWYHRLIQKVLELRGANRFVAKLPSHSVRVPWLNEIFPDALFVQSLRDWRPVVTSTMEKRRRDFPNTFFGVRTKGWQEYVEQPFHIGAAWQYARVHEILEHESKRFGDRFCSVWYEDLCADPAATMRSLLEFLGLPFTAEVQATLPTDIRPPSTRWQTVLDSGMIAEMRERFGDTLSRYEYPPTAAQTASA